MTQDNPLNIRKPEESALCSGLYIVPTPIGNLRDITLRALDVFHACDVIVCEDARVTGKLLKAYGITIPKKIVYNDHADDVTKSYILSLIADDKIVALVSDAGTPMISDPGFKLARDAVAGGYYVTALPGANAILPALQLSAMPTDKFIFVGFLPSRDTGVREVLKNYAMTLMPVIFYESPNRIVKTMTILNDIYPNRRIAIVREVSKLFEESIRGLPSEILNRLSQKPIKGEIVLILEGVDEKQEETYDIDALIKTHLREGESVKSLSQIIAEMTGRKRKEIYNRAIHIQNE